ncbi:MAG: molybdopterin biosynthesis protein [Halobacteriota archaeon]
MSDRREFKSLATPATARETIDSLDLGGGTESVPVTDATGRVLADRIDADLDVPGFDRASMDGYAVRARDTFGADEADPATLALIGAVHAGAEPAVTVEPGTCAEISTGAVMPPGADAVVIVERTDELDDENGNRHVEVRTSVAPGDSVMTAGADIAAGARALGPGTVLTPREIGLLAALGRDSVPVRSQPTVGIISTGDELVRPGEELDSTRGEIYDVNSHTIATAVAEAGGEPIVYPHAGDDYDEMERLLRKAADECDLVCSSGSTSASAVDVIYRVIEARGELLLHGVSVKPGKPMLVGRMSRSDGGESAYVGLPGYPVSALTIFRTFVAPAIRSAAGLSEPATATVTGRMAGVERYTEGRTRLMPVGLLEDETGQVLVYPVDKGSGATTSLVEADGIVEVDADTSYLDAGESVTVTLFSPEVRPPSLLGVGEDDPALNRLLDRVSNPRYLPVGSREGSRRLRNGLADVTVLAGPIQRDVEAVEIGGWSREWGLLVPASNPDGVTGIDSLVESDLRFVNRESTSGLRTSLRAKLSDLAAERGVDERAIRESIDGYDFSVKGFESPGHRVAAGTADVGIGLRESADRLGLGFVPIGRQRVRVLANPDRVEKAGVRTLREAIERGDGVFDALAGYDR